MSRMKMALTVLRVIAVALWNDPKIKAFIIGLFYRLFGVTNQDVMGLVRDYPRPTTRKLPDAYDMFLKCLDLGLKTRPGFEQLKDFSFWNGMGPDSWSEGLRNYISDKLDCILPCSMPHDDWYANGNDGTYETWHRTMTEWDINSDICLKDRAKTCSRWQREVNWTRAQIASQALEIGAYAAWLDAYKRQNPTT